MEAISKGTQFHCRHHENGQPIDQQLQAFVKEQQEALPAKGTHLRIEVRIGNLCDPKRFLRKTGCRWQSYERIRQKQLPKPIPVGSAAPSSQK
jgi:hypothetical protein